MNGKWMSSRWMERKKTDIAKKSKIDSVVRATADYFLVLTYFSKIGYRFV